MRSSCQTA